MNICIKKFLKKISKGLLIFIFVVFVFIPLFDFWVEHPLIAGTLLIILYFIFQWIENHIPYFKKGRNKGRKDEDKFI